MVDAFNITQDRIARSRLAGDPPDVMIAPKLARMGLFEFHRAAECIELGRQAAERALPDIVELDRRAREPPADAHAPGRLRPSRCSPAWPAARPRSRPGGA